MKKLLYLKNASAYVREFHEDDGDFLVLYSFGLPVLKKEVIDGGRTLISIIQPVHSRGWVHVRAFLAEYVGFCSEELTQSLQYISKVKNSSVIRVISDKEFLLYKIYD